MNRLLILIVALLGCVGTALSQNANRSGLFFELGLGAVLGDRPLTGLDYRDDVYEVGNTIGTGFFQLDVYRKNKACYGLGINAAVGYRWSISRHMAVDLKVKFQDATYEFSKTTMIGFMPGVRYISSEFKGNKSFYINAGIGAGIFPEKMCLPYEIGAGINFSNHFYCGLSWDAQYSFADKYVYGKHYGVAGAKFGFRL